jgi:predicted thioesterase
MKFDLREGLQHISKKIVEEKDTAIHYGSGGLSVFATPAMIALMENAAMLSVTGYLPKNMDTVGISVEIEHTKASSVGTTIETTAVLTKIEGRRLMFLVKANDENGEIGKGVHIRYIIEKEKFMSKLTK